MASHELNPTGLSNQTSEAKSPPVNLLSVSIPVQYQITNLSNWAYTNSNPESVLKGIAERSVAHYLASSDMDHLMAEGRDAAAVTLRSNMQGSKRTRCSLKLARVMFVGLEDIHPPTKVAKIFEDVVGAAETRQSKYLDAQGYASGTNAQAEGESFRRVEAARADEHAARTNSAARAILFASQKLAYSAAPGHDGVYEQRAYLDTLVQNSHDLRKYVVTATNSPNIMILNLEDKIRKEIDRPGYSSHCGNK